MTMGSVIVFSKNSAGNTKPVVLQTGNVICLEDSAHNSLSSDPPAAGLLSTFAIDDLKKLASRASLPLPSRPDKLKLISVILENWTNVINAAEPDTLTMSDGLDTMQKSHLVSIAVGLGLKINLRAKHDELVRLIREKRMADAELPLSSVDPPPSDSPSDDVLPDSEIRLRCKKVIKEAVHGMWSGMAGSDDEKESEGRRFDKWRSSSVTVERDEAAHSSSVAVETAVAAHETVVADPSSSKDDDVFNWGELPEFFMDIVVEDLNGKGHVVSVKPDDSVDALKAITHILTEIPRNFQRILFVQS